MSVKTRWQTFGIRCGLCGRLRLARTTPHGEGHRVWRFCETCDKG